MPDGLLSGYRALDLTDHKGFICGKILAALGVETIKIEKPGGDSDRYIPPFFQNQPDPILWEPHPSILSILPVPRPL